MIVRNSRASYSYGQSNSWSAISVYTFTYIDQPMNVEIPEIRDSGILVAARFVRDKWLILVPISIVLLLPCFWHKHIEAGDLGSHTYNAWLVQLIQQGRAPGLWVKHLHDNVLFDWMLSGFGSLFGFALGEKIAVSLAALLFFWSAFAFVCAISRSVPWTLLPAIAMLTYGWTFQVGFFNYYLAVAFSFLMLSIFYVTSGWKRLYALALTPLIFLAHPLGLAWFLGAALYIFLAERAPPRLSVHLPAIAGLLLIIIHRFIWHSGHRARFGFKWVGESGGSISFYAITGLDQLVVYSNRYKLLAAGMFLFVIACFLCDVAKRRNEEGYWARWRLPLELYIVVELGVLLLPDIVELSLYATPLSVLLQRLGLLAAILMLALLGTLQKRTWHGVGFGLFACVFFIFLYHDTARLDSMETRAEQLLSALPFGTRVMATIHQPAAAPLYSMIEVVDRACIERCFSFGNYEPPSRQFRVRALPGNGIVTTSSRDSGDIEAGTYIVKPEDLPAYQVYQCSPFNLCIRKLKAGEKNDPLGILP
jgi:hypothetical protein